MAYSYGDVYALLISQGATPQEAQTLAAISMAESGGNPAAANVSPQERSYGLFQINTNAHPLSPQQASDPVTSAQYAIQLERDQGYTPWSAYTSGSYERYMPMDYTYGDPQGIEGTQWPDTGTKSGGWRLEPIGGGAGVLIGPDGNPFLDDLGNPTIRNIKDPAGTGITPYQQGQLNIGYGGQALSKQQQLALIDHNEKQLQWSKDQWAQANQWDKDKWAQQVAQDQRALDQNQKQFDATFGANQKNTQFNQGVSVGELTGIYEGQPTLQKQQLEYNMTRGDRQDAETVRQFDLTLKDKIDARQQDLVELRMQLASSDAQNAARIAAQIQSVQMEVAKDMQIAAMDNSTKLQIAKDANRVEMRGQDITQRGQDISANVAYRGQDVTREGNILQANQARAQYAIETLRNDPVAQALYVTGGNPTGAMTPSKYALQQFQIPALPSIGAADIAPRIAPLRLQAGGTIESNNGVLAVVGEKRPQSAELALLQPGSVVEPMNLGRGASKDDVRQGIARTLPRLMQRANGTGVPMMADGGQVSDPAVQAMQLRQQAIDALNRGDYRTAIALDQQAARLLGTNAGIQTDYGASNIGSTSARPVAPDYVVPQGNAKYDPPPLHPINIGTQPMNLPAQGQVVVSPLSTTAQMYLNHPDLGSLAPTYGPGAASQGVKMSGGGMFGPQGRQVYVQPIYANKVQTPFGQSYQQTGVAGPGTNVLGNLIKDAHFGNATPEDFTAWLNNLQDQAMAKANPTGFTGPDGTPITAEQSDALIAQGYALVQGADGSVTWLSPEQQKTPEGQAILAQAKQAAQQETDAMGIKIRRPDSERFPSRGSWQDIANATKGQPTSLDQTQNNLLQGLAALMGGGKPVTGGVNDVNATMKTALTNTFYGKPAAPGDLAAREPLYGVNVPLPNQMATDWWSVPQPTRQMRYSAYGVQNMPQDYVDQMVQQATPTVIKPLTVGYGQRGLVVRPIAA